MRARRDSVRCRSAGCRNLRRIGVSAAHACHAVAGNRAEALRVYATCTRASILGITGVVSTSPITSRQSTRGSAWTRRAAPPVAWRALEQVRWGGWRVSNPRLPEPQSGALPL